MTAPTADNSSSDQPNQPAQPSQPHLPSQSILPSETTPATSSPEEKWGEPPAELEPILTRLLPPWRAPDASWRIDDPNDPVSLAAKSVNSLNVFMAYLTQPQWNDRIQDHASRIGARTGMTEWKAEQVAMVGLILPRFPRLSEIAMDGLLNFQLVHQLCEHLEAADTSKDELIDHAMVRLLQPTVRNQAMRTVTWVNNTVTQLLQFLDPIAVPMPEDSPESEADADAGADADTDNNGINPDDVPPMDEDTYHDGVSSFSYDNRDPNYTTFTLTVDAITGVELLKAINNAATTNNTTQGQAFLGLLRGQTTASITLNLYKNTFGLPLDDVFGEGHWLTTAASAAWLDRITHLAGAGTSDNNGYQPSARTAAMVAGRDGHCRFPGCTIPAHRCQIDHVHRYDHTNPTTSGPTSTDNLHLLCAKHHRLKTAGNWDVTLHPDGTETWTSHGDGHTITTTSDGPLGRETFQHKATRRVAVVRSYNEERLEQERIRRQKSERHEDPPF
ncbi:HNH endonuclease signature motif containing protein [Corynebacterium auriscanis]|uniref:HNH endonuclease signature motif containing protein n=1 Tax=Corynebacterium auriscanis TaxID=99807 RepID=UPI003CF8764F